MERLIFQVIGRTDWIAVCRTAVVLGQDGVIQTKKSATGMMVGAKPLTSVDEPMNQFRQTLTVLTDKIHCRNLHRSQRTHFHLRMLRSPTTNQLQPLVSEPECHAQINKIL